MTHADMQALVDRHVTTWNKHDAAALAVYHSINGVVESPMYAKRDGRPAIEEAYAAFFKSFPDAAATIDATVIDPPSIAVFSTIQATHMDDFFGLAGTNRRIEFRNVRLFRLDEAGLIAYERRIYDFTGLLVQIGVLRAKPAKP